MIIKSVELEKVVGVTTRGLPESGRPEFAFAGRSNVGKSSLINGLVMRNSLARTSGSPGKTQTMNFYNVNNEITLVDLPGYGYARVDQDMKQSWGRMIENYLAKSVWLCGIFLLVDIRHEPTQDDIRMFEWIREQSFEPRVIATKLDKLKRSEVKKCISVVSKTLGLEDESRIIPYSAESKAGRDEIWEAIDEELSRYNGKI